MSAAAFLLTDKSKSITSIAEEPGYSSPEHFSAAFSLPLVGRVLRFFEYLYSL